MKKHLSNEGTLFPIKFSKLIFWLSIAALAFCVIGIGVSVYNIVRFGVQNVSDALKYPFLIVICLLSIVLVLSILLNSYYLITSKKMVIRHGIIKSEYPVSAITALILDRDKNKLILYMGEAYFMVITVAPDKNEAFARALLAVNGDIDFSYTITENKPPENEN